ncbi:hypothetical protein [Sphingobium yanoikuyae]|uniref:hypothetical protein n=1 Tax=Sphingobium yanoikuyae TaxID=13690 RepID=UPI003B8A8FE6
MKRARFTKEQIISVLKKQEAAKTAELPRLQGVSEAKRLWALEDERAQMKLLAETMLDNAGLTDCPREELRTPAAMRKAVARLQAVQGIRSADISFYQR